MTISSELLPYISALLGAGGGGAVIAYLAFKKFGETWLDAKFSEKLEAFRHEKAKEIEKLRSDIDGTLKAKLRLQERQFESIVSVWDTLKSAQEKMSNCVSMLQSYSDIRQMDDEARREYFSTFDLQEWQKKEILGASDKQKSFSSMVDRKRLSEAVAKFNDFGREFRVKELYFSEEIASKLKSILDKMHSVLVSKDVSLESTDRQLSREAWRIYSEECVPEIDAFSSVGRTLLGSGNKV